MHDTCTWLFESQQYIQWSTRQNLDFHQGLLWIKGKPGSGKSTLMKEAHRRATTDDEAQNKIIMAFFFNARGNEYERSASGLFRSLVHQLANNDEKALSDLVELYLANKEIGGRVLSWEQAELEALLSDHLSRPRDKRIDIYLDALDECNESDARNIVEFFRERTFSGFSLGTNLNVCFSSRHYPNISVSQCPEVMVEGRNGKDIAKYVETKLVKGNPLYSTIMQGIANDIVTKASGVFLWAVLVVEMLRQDADRGCSPQAMEKRLKEIPIKLDDLFTHLFDHSTAADREEAMQLWQWVLLVQRPLTILELHQALAFSTEFPPSELNPKKQMEDMEAGLARFRLRMLNLSRGLIEVVTLQQHVKERANSPVPSHSSQASTASSGSPGLLEAHNDYSAFPNDQSTRIDPDARVQFIHETVKEFFNQKGFS
jgi:protein SERAC1